MKMYVLSKLGAAQATSEAVGPRGPSNMTKNSAVDILSNMQFVRTRKFFSTTDVLYPTG